MTLYLKYRPKNLDELDLPHVAESLKKIAASGKIPHAFLFSGPKGTGKTSAARILAKIINCENLGKDMTPCDKCNQCKSIARGNNLDVVEMDAASHRGIDGVRTLRDAVKLAPSGGGKKIYIIDEAHMLTTEASNALLKTLEEPPEHVVFILATTNPEKLIDTVRSRTTEVNFRKAKNEEIIKALKRVAGEEKIKITDEILSGIAEISGGAFRDAIKLLEQYSLEGDSYLLSFKNADLGNLIKYLALKDERMAIEEIENYAQNGSSVEFLTKNLIDLLHKALLSKAGMGEFELEGLTKDDILTLTELMSEAYKNMADSPIEQLPLEIAAFKWCGKKTNNSKLINNRDEVKKTEPAPVKEEIKTVKEIENADIAMPVNDDIWKSILTSVRPINASIEGLLRASRPVNYDGKTLTLGVFYKFHKERLEDGRHRKVLEDVIAKVLNGPTKVVCTLIDPPPRTVIEEAKDKPVLTESKEPDIIKAAEEIFGS